MAAPSMSVPSRTGIIHVHSNYSHDGVDSLPVLRESCLARKISFVGLTDHAEDLTPAIFDRYVEECRALSDDRLHLIPGLEYRFAGFAGLHLLALGLTRWITPRTPEEFLEEARTAAAFTIVAHPILATYRLPPAVQERIDALEVWNAAYNTRYLPDPTAVAVLHQLRQRRPSVVGVAGLDQHDSSNDRGTRVVIDGEGDPLAALRAGRFLNVGLTMRFDPSVDWSPWRLAVFGMLRRVLDRVERLQERVVRAARGSRGR